MGAAGLDEGVVADVFKTNANVSKPRSRKHFGNVSPRFLEETAEARENQRRNHVTASSRSSHSATCGNRGRNVNRNRSK